MDQLPALLGQPGAGDLPRRFGLLSKLEMHGRSVRLTRVQRQVRQIAAPTRVMVPPSCILITASSNTLPKFFTESHVHLRCNDAE